MRRLLLLICLMPAAAEARDVNIYVDYVIRQERVSPQPQLVRPRYSLQLVLREDGTVNERLNVSGRYAENSQSLNRLGRDRYRVMDERTISRSWSIGAQRRTLTVTTQGNTCTARLAITGAAEFTARSTDLNVTARYRNSEVESINCRIQ